MMVMYRPKHVASHTIKYDVFDENCFIILVRTNRLLLQNPYDSLAYYSEWSLG